MICPVCKKDMFVVEYKQIELDYCHTCKGVWFDAGELELLLETGGLKDAGQAWVMYCAYLKRSLQK